MPDSPPSQPPRLRSTGGPADRTEASAAGAPEWGGAAHSVPRIAVYSEADGPPLVVPVDVPGCGDAFGAAPSGRRPMEQALRDGAAGAGTSADGAGGDAQGAGDAEAEAVLQLMEALATEAHQMAEEQGGSIPFTVLRELIDNLVHASFAGVVITILDGGNTVRISDQGPGIADKESALRPGFTSADTTAKRYIRGVGSGFSVVRRTLAAVGGTLEIEDNLGRGTVITARVPPSLESPLAPIPAPEYNLSERQLKVLLLTVELAPVGPTRIARELGVSTSTAYRELVSLEEAGFVACRPSGHRSATDAGLAYLDAVL